MYPLVNLTAALTDNIILIEQIEYNVLETYIMLPVEHKCS